MIAGAVAREGFTLLGAFVPRPDDGVPADTRAVVLIGNAGPAMFRRFERERAAAGETLDQWTRRVVDGLARQLGARAVYPFEQPYPPIQAWARRAGAGFASPLGLNIHPRYGLWHAFRAALLMPRDPALPEAAPAAHPCEGCADRPCLHACPVGAFTARGYDTVACGALLAQAGGQRCMSGGCLARHACPVGQEYAYAPAQAAFHMRAFRDTLATAG